MRNAGIRYAHPLSELEAEEINADNEGRLEPYDEFNYDLGGLSALTLNLMRCNYSCKRSRKRRTPPKGRYGKETEEAENKGREMERLMLKNLTREKKEKEMVKKEEERTQRLEKGKDRITKEIRESKLKENAQREKLLCDMEVAVKNGAEEERINLRKAPDERIQKGKEEQQEKEHQEKKERVGADRKRQHQMLEMEKEMREKKRH